MVVKLNLVTLFHARDVVIVEQICALSVNFKLSPFQEQYFEEMKLENFRHSIIIYNALFYCSSFALSFKKLLKFRNYSASYGGLILSCWKFAKRPSLKFN